MSQQLRVAAVFELATEMLRDEIRRTAGDVDVFSDEIAVDPGDEVIRIEIEVLDVRIQLRRDVIPQPFRIHPDIEVAQRAQTRAARLRHLLAGELDEPVDVHVVGDLVRRPGKFQHRRPEQGMKVDDVLADEMDLLGVGRRQKLLEAARLAPGARLTAVEVVFQRGEVADGASSHT